MVEATWQPWRHFITAISLYKHYPSQKLHELTVWQLPNSYSVEVSVPSKEAAFMLCTVRDPDGAVQVDEKFTEPDAVPQVAALLESVYHHGGEPRETVVQPSPKKGLFPWR